MALSLISKCCSSEEQKAKERSAEINKTLVEHKRYLRKELKLLLLGYDDSGKSTFLKQMRMIYGTGFSENEKRDLIKVILRNLCAGMQTLISAMNELKIPYADASNNERSFQFRVINFTWKNAVVPTTEHIEVCKILWSDSGIRECFSRRREYFITESAKYYLPMIDIVTVPGYIPTEKDYMYGTDCTSGLKEFSFELDGTPIRIIDMGGYRMTRKLFPRFFENATSIIFMVALSNYDQPDDKMVRDKMPRQRVISLWTCSNPLVQYHR